MDVARTSRQDQKKKKKQLRKGLLAFLKRLREACKSFDSLSDWKKFVQPVQDLLDQYEDQLPPAVRQSLQDALRVKDETKEGIEKACKLLDKNIEGAIEALPVTASVGTVLLGVVIAAAVLMVAAYAVLEATSKEVTITNHNCGDVVLFSGGMDLPGLHLPEMIADNGQETARVPGFLSPAVEVENNGMTFWLVTENHFTFKKQVLSATFNGVSIVGVRTELNFGSQPQNELAFTCQ